MHPLSRPHKSPTSHSSHPAYPKYTGDGSIRSIAQWAKQVPVVETVIENGVPVEVYNPRQRITVLSPSYGFQVTEHYLGSYIACLQVTARFRMPDGSIAVLPVIADRLNVPNDSHIDRARNTITNIWVDQDITDLAYWWDVDIPVPPEYIGLVWSHLVNGIRFVCGHYAMKDIVPTFVANVAKLPQPGDDPNLIELLDGGTGSMGWHREVPLKLREHPEAKPYVCAPNSPFGGQIHYTYFSSGPYGGKIPLEELAPEQRARVEKTHADGVPQWLSEDWKVCRMWQELGGKVYGDRRIKLQHFGGLLYPPTVESLTLATQAMIRGNHPAVQADKLRALLANYKDPTTPTPAGAAAPVVEFPKAA